MFGVSSVLGSTDPLEATPGLYAYWSADNAVHDGSTISSIPNTKRFGITTRDLLAVGGLAGNPVYTAQNSDFNYKPSVSCANQIRRFRIAAFGTPSLLHPNTWYLVCKISTTANPVYFRVGEDGNFTGSSGYVQQTDNTTIAITQDGGAAITTAAVANGVHVICVVYNAGSSAVYVDNSVTPFLSGTTNNQPFTDILIGSFAASTYAWTTQAGYDGAHSASVRARIMHALGKKYAIDIDGIDYRPLYTPVGSFDPATLSLTGWWRGSYSASPWTGTASAGASGGNDLSEATTPPGVGATQNGFAPIDCNGTTQFLATSGQLNTYVNDAAGSCWVLFRADTAAASGGATVRVDDAGIVAQDSGATAWGITYSTDGVCGFIYDGAYQEIVVTAATGSYHLAQMKWDGVNLYFRTNSGVWQNLACTGISGAAAGVFVTGRNYAAAFYDGRVLDIGLTDAVLSDTEFDNIKSYVNSRYALSL